MQSSRVRTPSAKQAEADAASSAPKSAPKPAASPAPSAAARRARQADLQAHAADVLTQHAAAPASDATLLARVAELENELAAAQATIAAKDAETAQAAVLAAQQLRAAAAEKGKVESDLEGSRKDHQLLGLQHELEMRNAKAAADEALVEEVREATKRVREDAEADAEVERSAASAKVQRLEETNRGLVQSVESYAAAAAAGGGGKPKKARGKKAAPTSAAAAAMLAAGEGEGEGEAAPAKPVREGPNPYAQFACATREWTPDTSGASDFFGLVGVESAADFKTKFQSDAHWCAQLLASPELPTDFEAALRAVCDNPEGVFAFAEGGEAYKNLAMLVARLGWPSLGITADQTSITQGEDAEQTHHIAYQIKKAISGINQVVQPYNLYRQLVCKDADFVPITMTAKKETFRNGKAMYATRRVRATAAGFGTVEEHERSLAERQRAEDAAAEAVAQLAASMEMDEAP
jgi:hypothetical protein